MIHLEPYRDYLEREWDEFILRDSANGTFVNTRNFINYHPPGKFTDSSLIFRNERKSIFAVLPACEIMEQGKRTFFSHRGCTYGGLVVKGRYHTAFYIDRILDLLLEYLKERAFERVVIKTAHKLYSSVDTDLLEFLLTLRGFGQYTELNTFLDFSSYKPDILSNFSQGKRTHVNNCLKVGMEFRRLRSDKEVAEFHKLLEGNLKKYNTAPVHTLQELLDFKNSRLVDIVRFYGVFLKEKMWAAGMIYEYKKSGTFYTTYLASDYPEDSSLSPATFLYYGVIKEAIEQGRNYLSFGISTEKQGRYLNYSLLQSKESYGALHSLHRSFYKDLKEERDEP